MRVKLRRGSSQCCAQRNPEQNASVERRDGVFFIDSVLDYMHLSNVSSCSAVHVKAPSLFRGVLVARLPPPILSLSTPLSGSFLPGSPHSNPPNYLSPHTCFSEPRSGLVTSRVDLTTPRSHLRTCHRCEYWGYYLDDEGNY